MSDELLPCPFCGGKAEVRSYRAPTVEEFYWCACTNCQAQSPPQADDATIAEAVAAWNKRAGSATDAEEWRNHALDCDAVMWRQVKEIAELKALTQWQPVDDGIYASAIEISHGGEGLFIAEHGIGTFLPPQYRFCRKGSP